MGGSTVAVANEQVPIVTALQMFGVELPDDIGTGRSRKLHCPFGDVYHSDQGTSPAMRVYPETNSAYCFSCAAYFTPVSLAAKAMGCSAPQAAEQLLARVGYRPLDLAGQWHEAKTYEPDPDKALLADALKTYCRRKHPRWGQEQFEPEVAAVLTRCLSLLDLVKTAEDATAWLGGCKIAMNRALDREEPSLSQKYDLLLEQHRMRGGVQ